KIFDNLRRSLVPIALSLCLLEGWFLPQLARIEALLVPAIFVLPAILAGLSDLWRKPDQLPWLMHLRGVGRAIGRTLSQIGLTLAFLPYEAFVSLDAIARSMARMFVTRRQLLEWTTASELSRAARTDLSGFYLKMWVAPAYAAVGLLLAASKPSAQFGYSAP